MSGLFPLRGSVDLDEGREPRLVDLDDEVADEVFDALSSRTTREIFAELHSSPQTASDLAEVTDTSVQNAQYHLEKLVAADLVEVVDTWYSERGTEMKVYAPTDESLVLFAGNDKRGSLRTLLKRIVGVLALLFPVSAVAAWLADAFSASREVTDYQVPDSAAGGGGADAGGAGGDVATETASRGDAVADGGGVDAAGESRTVGDGSGDGGSVTDGSDGGDGGGVTDGGDGGGGGDGGDGGSVTDGGDGGDVGVADAPDPTATPSATDSAGGGSGGGDVGLSSVETQTSQPEQAATDTGATNLSDRAADFADATPTPTDVPSQEAVDIVVDAGGGTDPALLAGVAFFLGGVFVLALVAVAWYRRS